MLTYVSPAMMLASSAGRKFHTATFGEPSGRPNLTPDGTPGPEKPWMCAAISALVSGATFVSTTLTDKVSATVSMTNVPDQTASEAVGSCGPSMTAAKLTVAAGAVALRLAPATTPTAIAIAALPQIAPT